MEYVVGLLTVALFCLGTYTVLWARHANWRLDQHKEQIEFLTEQLAQTSQRAAANGHRQLMRD